jgi:hypothetical protein
MIVPITLAYPQPVEVVIAGRAFLVGEARVRDLVAIQAFIDRRARRPLEEVRGKLDGMTDEERGEALWGVYDALAADPPVWGNQAGWDIMDCAEGLRLIYSVVLRQCQPDLTAEEIELVALRATPEEFFAMDREWRRREPAEEVADMLDLPADEDSGGLPIPWTQAIAEVVELTGWTLEYIYNLHMSQITMIRTGGKRSEVGIKVAPKGGGLKEVVRFMRARWKAWKERREGNRDG